MSNFRVIVDADACPKTCLQIVQSLASVYDYEVITVASFNHQIENEHHLVVDNESQAADMAIMNHCRAGDVVITQDWGLAALILGKKGRVISPHGRIYRGDLIEMLLEERHILDKHRRNGGRTKGQAKRTVVDDQEFKENLVKILNQEGF